ncbi:MAG: hypothetical protein WA133_02975 [Syntrophales bacterium]
MTVFFDISDSSFSFDTKSLGSIVFYRLKPQDWLKLAAQTENLDDLNAKQVVAMLISFAAHRKTGDSVPVSNDDESRPSVEQLEQITDDEWEQISEKYIELDQSPCQEITTIVEKSKSGKPVSKEVVRNLVDLPRNVGEAAIDYLARIAKQHIKSTAEKDRRWKVMFDQNISKQFREASSAWSALTDSVSRFSTTAQSAKSLKIEEQPYFYTPRIDQKLLNSPFPDIKRRLADIADRQAELTPLMVNSANLLGKMYEVGSAIAMDFKKTIKQTSTYNKITIFIALSALFATVVFSVASYLSSREASKLSSDQMTSLIQEVQCSNKILSEMQDYNRKIEDMLRASKENGKHVGRDSNELTK